jgi:DNA-binding phage protein
MERDAMFEEIRVVRELQDESLGVLTFLAQDPAFLARQEERLRQYFGRRRRLADVYLALARDRNLTEVGEAIGMSRHHVWDALQVLRDQGLVTKHVSSALGDVWLPNPAIERTLKLKRLLREWFPETDGGPSG